MTLYVVALGVVLFIFERIRPNKPFVSVEKWYLKAISFNLFALAILTIGSFTWDLWFKSIPLFKMSDTIPNAFKGGLSILFFTCSFIGGTGQDILVKNYGVFSIKFTIAPKE